MFSTKEDIPFGYIDHLKPAERERVSIGRVIPFTELKSYVGKRVVEVLYTQDYDGTLHPWHKVVEITRYLVNADTIYKWSLDEHGYRKDGVKYVCDRVCYTDDNRWKKTNATVSEAFCSNGRFEPVGQWEPQCFYDFDVA